jgi:hypothetical protein
MSLPLVFIKLIFIFLFFIRNNYLFSQENENIYSKYLDISGRSHPSDQVFLHIDRNLYHAGDTIRFQGYIKDRQTGIFETKSISLFSLLINSAAKTIDSARFRITNSTSSGWLKVPEDISPGDYSIISFTSSMMNYDPSFVFSAPIRIDYLSPVHTKSDSTSKDITQSLQIPITDEKIDLKFLPEGGTFVCGIEQNLAFNAVTSTGRTLDVKGRIFNQKGEQVAYFKSGLYGLGQIELTPQEGYTYYATLSDDEFPEIGTEFSEMKWQLPIPEPSGVSLKLRRSDNQIIDLEVRGKEAGDKPYYLTMVMNNVIIFDKELLLDSLLKIKVPTDQLPIGTAFFTLFDSDFRPLAERLAFINSSKMINVDIKSLKEIYSKGSETEFSINTTDFKGDNVESVLSIAIIDSLSGIYSQWPFADIKTSLLFSEDFYNNLPDLIKMNGLGNINPKDLDLLIMTYGWRKFKERDLTDNEVIRDYKNYDQLIIKSKGNQKRSRNEINIMTIENSEMYSLKQVDSQSILKFDSLGSSVRQFMILTDKAPSKNINPIEVEFPENFAFRSKIKTAKTISQEYSNNITARKKVESDFYLDSTHLIESVTIKANIPNEVKVYNKYQIQYQNTNPVTLSPKDFQTCQTLEQILYRLNPYQIDNKKKTVVVSISRTNRFSTRSSLPALIVVDDVPLSGPFNSTSQKYESSYISVGDMPASNISSVTMVRGFQGFYIYGEEALGGVIFITTNGKAMQEGNYNDERSYTPKTKNDLAKPIRIFRSEIEFYIPTKAEVLAIPEFQYRTTLLWKNELLLDGKEPFNIKYPNNLYKGTIYIIINGVSLSNIPFTTMTKYSIN